MGSRHSDRAKQSHAESWVVRQDMLMLTIWSKGCSVINN